MTRRKYTQIGIIAAFATGRTASFYECLIPIGNRPPGSFTGEKIMADDEFVRSTGVSWEWADEDHSRFSFTVGYPRPYHTPNSTTGGPNEGDGSNRYHMRAWGMSGNGSVSTDKWEWEKCFKGSNRPYPQYATHAEIDNPEIGPNEQQYGTAYVIINFDMGLCFPTQAEFLQAPGGNYRGSYDNTDYPNVKFTVNGANPDHGFRFVRWHIQAESPIADENQRIIDSVDLTNINGFSFTTHETKDGGYRDDYTRLYIWAEFDTGYKRDGLIKCDGVGRIIFDPKTNMPIWY